MHLSNFLHAQKLVDFFLKKTAVQVVSHQKFNRYHMRLTKHILNQSHKRGHDYVTELILRAFNLLSIYLCDDDDVV